MLNNVICCNSSKIKSLASALNSIKNFMNFCCCKNENYIFRRFFKRFQKSIKRMICKHMNFVNNINFVSAVYWNVLNFFKNTLRILNLSITSSIDFNNINRHRVCNISTAFTLTARMNCRPVFAVQRFCKNSCSRSFTGSARTCE